MLSEMSTENIARPNGLMPNLFLAENRLERLERKKEGNTPPPGGGGDEVSNLDPPIHTRGPILFFFTISLFSRDFGAKNFSF